jgi:hypothetical protein
MPWAASQTLKFRVLDLQPVPTPAARIEAAQTLRDNPFKPEPARVVEHDSAVALDRLAERKPVYPGDDGLQLCATDLEREPAPVLAFKLQKVEGDEGRLSCAAIGSQRRKSLCPSGKTTASPSIMT